MMKAFLPTKPSKDVPFRIGKGLPVLVDNRLRQLVLSQFWVSRGFTCMFEMGVFPNDLERCDVCDDQTSFSRMSLCRFSMTRCLTVTGVSDQPLKEA